VRRRWWVLVASMLLLVGAVGLLTTGIVTTPNNERLVGDSAAAATIVKQADFGDRPTEMVVVTTRAAALDEATAAQLAQRLPAAYRGVAGIAEVGTPMPGKDGRSWSASCSRSPCWS
jgi:RND superfamily putative drug exporter